MLRIAGLGDPDRLLADGQGLAERRLFADRCRTLQVPQHRRNTAALAPHAAPSLYLREWPDLRHLGYLRKVAPARWSKPVTTSLQT
jgi:hypothetical protein